MVDCFNCGKWLYDGMTTKALARLRMPVFCSNDCAFQFPDNDTPEFEDKLKELIHAKNG